MTTPTTTLGRTRDVARRAMVVAVTLAVGCGLLIGAATAAQASSYRYWTYWVGDSGTWAFSSIGAARRPPDGGVEGWRFEVSQAAASSQPPRTPASFAAICGSTQPVAGMKRVALVIDYGTSADAPPGEHPPGGVVASCEVVDVDATGYAVLGGVSSIRAQGGLVCGIGGYPAAGCGEPVSDPTPSPSPSRTHANGGPGTATGGVGADLSKDPTTPTPSAPDPSPGKHGTRATGGRDAPGASGSTHRPQTKTSVPTTSASGAAAPTGASGSTTGPAGLLAGLAVVGLVASAGIVVARRRR